MSLAAYSHDSLPYIDIPLSPSLQSAAESLIKAELSSVDTSTLHPSLPAEYIPTFSPLIQTELDRVANKQPLTNGIDLSRYETPDPPAASDASSKEWSDVLNRAYTSHEHLRGRLANLNLLNEFGKNGWLVHNWQLEGILASLERELVNMKEECDEVNKGRKKAQEEVKEEMDRLERRWQEGIGKMIEVEVAGEEVRGKILETRREKAQRR